MTRFWRDGYWRSSIYGNEHWVEGHFVDRDDWHRNEVGESYSANFRNWLATVRADQLATSRYVNPNADCPVCGQPVFFYQNEYGSRVYFDELGPPWPKHPCTDHANVGRPRYRSPRDAISPTLRGSLQVSQIRVWLSSSGLDMSTVFRERYAADQWDCWQIDGRFKVAAGVLLILQSIPADEPRRLFLLALHAPRSIKRGAFVFIRRRRLAYFDLAAMEPAEIDVKRIRTASAFVDELVAREPERAVRP